MNCEWRQKAVLYADDELGPVEQEEVSAHVSKCAECAAAIVGHMELKKVVRVAGRRFTAPAELRARIRADIPSAPRRRAWWQWILAPATLLVLAVLAFLLVPRRQNESVLAELVDQHITTLASQNPVDVISSDRHTVKPWFQGKLPFSFNLPELANSQFVLLGGKMAYYEQHPGAELLYELRKHRISIFVFQDGGDDKLLAQPDHQLAFTVETWREAGLQFCLVTDLDREDAHRLATMFADANKALEQRSRNQTFSPQRTQPAQSNAGSREWQRREFTQIKRRDDGPQPPGSPTTCRCCTWRGGGALGCAEEFPTA